MHEIVPVIIILIICVQVFFFVKNYLRMRQFCTIFEFGLSWYLEKNTETGFVTGVGGNGNTIFSAIVDSINKYLGPSAGSVIDFGLLKDAVDRHCDSVENDISAQTPIPLYWGLAGTMVGVILGLVDLLQSDAIMTLMGSSGGVVDAASRNAASGVNSLLSGVAWAMGASICGILLTTANSLLFKRCKLKEEEGKNSFLAWMQSNLLPELPSDISDALNKLVVNLNKFNDTFAANTADLGKTLAGVNESYAIQADIIEAVHDMDVMKMAKANVAVLRQLEQCTDKLEVFYQYLNNVEGYTKAIHRFESLFNKEAKKLHVLEEIRDFFAANKGSIAKTASDAENALKESLSSIKESTAENVDSLQKQFISQSDAFKTMLSEEQTAFECFTSKLKAQFNDQMQQMPQLAKQLEEIAAIPERLNDLIIKVEKSNTLLANNISQYVKQSLSGLSKGNVIPITENKEGFYMPKWMKITGWAALVTIALTCIFNVVIMIFNRFFFL